MIAETTPIEREVDEAFNDFLDAVERERERLGVTEEELRQTLARRIGDEASDAYMDWVIEGQG